MVRLPELHDPKSGRIDASKVAGYLGVPLADLAKGLGAKNTTVHKTPDGPALQGCLASIKRSLDILDEVMGNAVSGRAWLNSPHPDLGMRTPFDAILQGHADALRRMLENAVLGVPA